MYAILLNQLAPNTVVPAQKVLEEKDMMKRAELILESAGRLQLRELLTAEDIVNVRFFIFSLIS